MKCQGIEKKYRDIEKKCRGIEKKYQGIEKKCRGTDEKCYGIEKRCCGIERNIGMKGDIGNLYLGIVLLIRTRLQHDLVSIMPSGA